MQWVVAPLPSRARTGCAGVANVVGHGAEGLLVSGGHATSWRHSASGSRREICWGHTLGRGTAYSALSSRVALLRACDRNFLSPRWCQTPVPGELAGSMIEFVAWQPPGLLHILDIHRYYTLVRSSVFFSRLHPYGLRCLFPEQFYCWVLNSCKELPAFWHSGYCRVPGRLVSLCLPSCGWPLGSWVPCLPCVSLCLASCSAAGFLSCLSFFMWGTVAARFWALHVAGLLQGSLALSLFVSRCLPSRGWPLPLSWTSSLPLAPFTWVEPQILPSPESVLIRKSCAHQKTMTSFSQISSYCYSSCFGQWLLFHEFHVQATSRGPRTLIPTHRNIPTHPFCKFHQS